MSWRFGLRMRGFRPEDTASQSERLTGLKLSRDLGQVGNKTLSTYLYTCMHVKDADPAPSTCILSFAATATLALAHIFPSVYWNVTV